MVSEVQKLQPRRTVMANQFVLPSIRRYSMYRVYSFSKEGVCCYSNKEPNYLHWFILDLVD